MTKDSLHQRHFWKKYVKGDNMNNSWETKFNDKFEVIMESDIIDDKYVNYEIFNEVPSPTEIKQFIKDVCKNIYYNEFLTLAKGLKLIE